MPSAAEPSFDFEHLVDVQPLLATATELQFWFDDAAFGSVAVGPAHAEKQVSIRDHWEFVIPL